MVEKFILSSALYFCGSLAILIISLFCEERLRNISKIFTILFIILILDVISLVIYIFKLDEISSTYLISTLQTLAAIVPVLFGFLVSSRETSIKLEKTENQNHRFEKELEELNRKKLELIKITEYKDRDILELENKIKDLTCLIKEKDSKILESATEIDSHLIYEQNINNVNNLFGSIILHIAEKNVEYCFVYVLRIYNIYKAHLCNLDQTIDSQQYNYLKSGYKLILVKLTFIIQMIVLFAAEQYKAEKLLSENVIDPDLMSDLNQKLEDFVKYDRQIQDI